MLDGEVTDHVEGAALSLNPQHVHAYSASWGPGKIIICAVMVQTTGKFDT